jgi:hypothetical protein
MAGKIRCIHQTQIISSHLVERNTIHAPSLKTETVTCQYRRMHILRSLKANLYQITELRFAVKYLYRSRVWQFFVFLLFNYHPVRRTTGYIATPLDDIVCGLLCSALIGCRVLGTASQYRENRYRFHLIGYRLFHKYVVITCYT